MVNSNLLERDCTEDQLQFLKRMQMKDMMQEMAES